MDDQLCLKWRSHNDAIAEIAFRFLEHESLVDVTLACPENGQVHYFKAHQIILSACSPYFESLFLYNTHPHPVIFLKDVKKSELENILIFMYRGEVNVHYNRIKDVIDTAKSLMIRGLSDEVYDADAETSKRTSSSVERCHPKKRKCVEVKVEEKNEDFGNTYQEVSNSRFPFRTRIRFHSTLPFFFFHLSSATLRQPVMITRRDAIPTTPSKWTTRWIIRWITITATMKALHTRSIR